MDFNFEIDRVGFRAASDASYADVSHGGLWVDPALPESFGDLHITNAPLAGGRITIDVAGSTASVKGLPEGMTFHLGRRQWLAGLVVQAKPHPKT